MYDCILCLVDGEAITSDKVADRISVLAMELYKPNEVGEVHE